MRALVFHGPGQKGWEEVPNPVVIDEPPPSAGRTCTSSKATCLPSPTVASWATKRSGPSLRSGRR
jgi:hypothetical protein